jgi:hypothetical protein
LANKDQIPVFLSDSELEGHYNQFCKQVRKFALRVRMRGKLTPMHPCRSFGRHSTINSLWIRVHQATSKTLGNSTWQ